MPMKYQCEIIIFYIINSESKVWGIAKQGCM